MKLPKKNNGFVLVTALGIFAVISIIGILIQTITFETTINIRNLKNYYESKDLADSIADILKYELSNHESGYNSTESCAPDDFENAVTGTVCEKIAAVIGDAEVTVRTAIRGRIDPSDPAPEKFSGTCPGFSTGNGCFTAPIPGNGNAGERCTIYKNNLDFSTGVNAGDTADLSGNISHINHSCNWNTLTFGSSFTDRVSIPLYYEDSSGQIVNPYYNNNGVKLIVRFRTPCLPCIYEGAPITGKDRLCVPGADESLCSDSERYLLDETDDDIIVQWQITGLCEVYGEETECGMIQYAEYEDSSPFGIAEGFSAINEGRINRTNANLFHDSDTENKVLYGDLLALDTTSYELVRLIKNPLGEVETEKLPLMRKPVLTLFLSGKLISEAGNNIPYLEYQVLTSEPIGNPRKKIEVYTEVNGNVFEKTVFEEEQQKLIDFAVQN